MTTPSAISGLVAGLLLLTALAALADAVRSARDLRLLQAERGAADADLAGASRGAVVPARSDD